MIRLLSTFLVIVLTQILNVKNSPYYYFVLCRIFNFHVVYALFIILSWIFDINVINIFINRIGINWSNLFRGGVYIHLPQPGFHTCSQVLISCKRLFVSFVSWGCMNVSQACEYVLSHVSGMGQFE